MSNQDSYWKNAFKPWYTQYKRTDYRLGVIRRDHYNDEVDNYDIPIEGSLMSKRYMSRQHESPYGLMYPRECAKFVGKYFECRNEHGIHSIADDAPAQCNDRKQLLFDECPHWVLENLAIKKKFYKRAELIDKITYDRAMEVSDYNQ
jgi:hypothetical protein